MHLPGFLLFLYYYYNPQELTILVVHPHMRGEYQVCSQFRIGYYGSPPHAWGILNCQPFRVAGLRFTPTCVGNTKSPLSTNMVEPVHPHMRGEYNGVSGGLDYPGGSPPHAWGIRFLYRLVPVYRRFTPTCVGNTRWGDIV